jgi:Zn-dependent protease
VSFGTFELLSLFYVVLGVRVIYQLARNFRQTFDRTFTDEDRMLVDQAAIFVLLPISVALHELGHAVAIWLYGGEVLGAGFYGFAGYVAFDPLEFTDAQQIVIAAAGTAVNLLLAAIAVALVFLKRPPFRAAINRLLIQFTWISLLNSLVVYPLLDFAADFNGDWRQMYGGGVPALSLVIFIIHITVLAALFWAWKSPAMHARVARLTGGSARSGRGSATSRLPVTSNVGATAVEQTFREAASRVASGWSSPVEAAIQRGRNGSALVLSWGTGAVRRSVMAVAPETGGVEFSGALRSGGGSPEQRPLGRDPGERDVDRLTMMLRLAMEAVEGWTPSSVVGRESEVGSERRLQGDG